MDWWRSSPGWDALLHLLEVEMPWRTYAISFMALAFVFVPVLFLFLIGGIMAPCCFGVYALLFEPGDGLIRGLIAAYLLIYSGIFYLAAILTFRLSTLVSNKIVRLFTQIAFLLLLFSCSFLTVVCEGADGINPYSSGTYNFWRACARFPHSPHGWGK